MGGELIDLGSILCWYGVVIFLVFLVLERRGVGGVVWGKCNWVGVLGGEGGGDYLLLFVLGNLGRDCVGWSD